ncbi:DUF5712 family protein [Fulvivirga lutea]|uniref:Clindamycin resistance transfer factor BtgB n=1 Tax=Fulvivirga lutea TaxID=2810512 RepID=A0A975A2T9_9BACT|nr:DUF5712 family protein [Fulvivirga lutea]QSE99191.1 hypothetical protein JR347_08910 [Fulvivirga lutea]
MYVKIEVGGTGSSVSAVEYLEKENEEKLIKDQRLFFDQSNDNIKSSYVVESLDNNKAKLCKHEAKFFQLIISPSKNELLHIGCSEEKIKLYTRNLMDVYAMNFDKGLRADDLLYFAKIEEFRKGKEGPNWHVHVLVSRKDKTNKIKLSPRTSHRGKSKGPISHGFNRNKFRQTSETLFNKMFDYSRSFYETFEYQNTLKNGKSMEEKLSILFQGNSLETKQPNLKQLKTDQYDSKKVSLKSLTNIVEGSQKQAEYRRRKKRDSDDDNDKGNKLGI